MSDGIINLSGKLYPSWPYVLNAAHEKGLLGVTTELVQIPTAENGNIAIVKATARFEGEEWSAYGDASDANVNPRIRTALIRMAETRAKGRALRDACNIGETMKEEMADDEPIHAPVPASRPPAAPSASPPAAAHSRAESPRGEALPAIGCEQCGVVLTLGQNTVSQRMYGKSLCPAHQRAAGELMGKIASRPAV